MYKVKFYRDKSDKSEIVELLGKLREKGETSKNERVNRDKILAYIGALEKYGTRIGLPVVRHHFIKKTQKTPPQEIKQARANMKDYIERFGE